MATPADAMQTAGDAAAAALGGVKASLRAAFSCGAGGGQLAARMAALVGSAERLEVALGRLDARSTVGGSSVAAKAGEWLARSTWAFASLLDRALAEAAAIRALARPASHSEWLSLVRQAALLALWLDRTVCMSVHQQGGTTTFWELVDDSTVHEGREDSLARLWPSVEEVGGDGAGGPPDPAYPLGWGVLWLTSALLPCPNSDRPHILRPLEEKQQTATTYIYKSTNLGPSRPSISLHLLRPLADKTRLHHNHR
jgi:hypothetical protein